MPDPTATAAHLDTCEHKQCIPFDRCLYGGIAGPTQPLDTAACVSCGHTDPHDVPPIQLCRSCPCDGPCEAPACMCPDPLREVHPGCPRHGHSPEAYFEPDTAAERCKVCVARENAIAEGRRNPNTGFRFCPHCGARWRRG